MPVIGPILAYLENWLLGQLKSLIFAKCDGLVALEQIVKLGKDLQSLTASGPYTMSNDPPWDRLEQRVRFKFQVQRHVGNYSGRANCGAPSHEPANRYGIGLCSHIRATTDRHDQRTADRDRDRCLQATDCLIH